MARLEVISVRKLTAAIKTISIANKFNPFKEINCSPSHIDKPLISNALAKAIPPPKAVLLPKAF